jgi:hypothetical protein
MSYAHGVSDYVYLAILPSLMGMYYLSFVTATKETLAQKKSFFFYTAAFCTLLLIESYKKGKLFDQEELIVFVTFCLWSLSTVFLGLEQFIKGRKKIFSKLLSLIPDTDNKVTSSRFDRIFFHDLINHTHALLLFLGTKKANGLSSDEVNNIVGELRLLQNNIQNQFSPNIGAGMYFYSDKLYVGLSVSGVFIISSCDNNVPSLGTPNF